MLSLSYHSHSHITTQAISRTHTPTQTHICPYIHTDREDSLVDVVQIAEVRGRTGGCREHVLRGAETQQLVEPVLDGIVATIPDTTLQRQLVKHVALSCVTQTFTNYTVRKIDNS